MSKFLDKAMWHTKLNCVVEVSRRGCFEEGTVMVKLPNDRIIQTDIRDLQGYHDAVSRAGDSEIGD